VSHSQLNWSKSTYVVNLTALLAFVQCVYEGQLQADT
jgi:hypothetical protein